MSCGEGLGIKPGRFSELSLFGKGKMRCVFGGYVCGNVKLSRFFMYPCRGVLHTSQNDPRPRFRPKIGLVLGVSLLEKVKPGAFLVYPCAEI